MTPTQLAEIEARAKAATEGPWEASCLPTGFGYDGALFDRRFIAHARQDIPDLIAHIRELEEEMNTLLREHNHALAAIREAS